MKLWVEMEVEVDAAQYLTMKHLRSGSIKKLIPAEIQERFSSGPVRVRHVKVRDWRDRPAI